MTGFKVLQSLKKSAETDLAAYRFAKPLYALKAYRGFESLRLRQILQNVLFLDICGSARVRANRRPPGSEGPIRHLTTQPADTKTDTPAPRPNRRRSGPVPVIAACLPLPARLARAFPTTEHAHGYMAAGAVCLTILASIALVLPGLQPGPIPPRAPIIAFAPKDQSRAPHTVGATVTYWETEDLAP